MKIIEGDNFYWDPHSIEKSLQSLKIISGSAGCLTFWACLCSRLYV